MREYFILVCVFLGGPKGEGDEAKVRIGVFEQAHGVVP